MDGKFHGFGNYTFIKASTVGLIFLDMKDSLEMAFVMAKEHGFQIIEMKKVIDMRGSIKMTRRVDLDYTDGKMERLIKANF